MILFYELRPLWFFFYEMRHWALSCDNYFSSNWGIEHLAMMILFSIILNDESGLSETSVAAWSISYDIRYMSSFTSRTLERWKAVNSATRTESNLFFQFWFLFENKFDAHPFVDNQMADLKNEVTQYESPNEGSGNVGGSDLYESPSPLHPLCSKRQWASGTEDPDYVLEQPIYDHWKLNVLIYTIKVLWMTLNFFHRVPLHVEVSDNYFLKIKRKGL
jgi:hypothetical protein